MWDWDLVRRRSRHTEFYYRLLGCQAGGRAPDADPNDAPLWVSRIHPEDLSRAQECLRDVVEGRRALYEAEYRLRHEDGSWRWVFDRGRVADRDESGRPTRLVGFVADITERVKSEEQRQNEIVERKRLEREIIEIANREQQRIGSDLHDGLGQDLTGIALMLRGVAAQLRREGSGARIDVEHIIGHVNNAIDSTRALARGLSPVIGERGGLAAAIQTLAARASERYGVRVDFQANFLEPLRLSETAATHIYRIVQEALTNVFRHSRATGVAVRLETSDGELRVRIDDNGRGFLQIPSDGAEGLGLKIMRYRAQMMGGDLVIESAVRGGASVRCSCPLDPIS
jgi:signal transduction histidine kinase